MKRIDDLVAAGDPVDPDLVSLLAAEGDETLEDVTTKGRAHWVALFADRQGFTRDFVEVPAEFGATSWETAPDTEALQRDLYDYEISSAATNVAQKLGASTFADVFRHSREDVQRAMAESGHMLGELDDFIARHGASW